MCYNIAFLTRRMELYAKRYEHVLPSPIKNLSLNNKEFPAYYWVNGFEHPELPVVTDKGIIAATWGLIPEWTSTESDARMVRQKTLNARGESIFEKPAFRQSANSKRCLLGIEGFYEWRLFKGNKYPYLILPASEQYFSLGCLYSEWINGDTGEIKTTFSIVTTPANELMAEIHNTKQRMPLLLPKNMESFWINSTAPPVAIENLITPFPSAEMQAITVSRRFNASTSNRNIPEAMQGVRYPELEPGNAPTLF